MSSTISTRRSRSGRHVRTTTSDAPGRRAPVDRADVVADHVLAQRVELGPRAADLDRRPPVQLPQPGEAARQVPARGELGQHAQPPGTWSARPGGPRAAAGRTCGSSRGPRARRRAGSAPGRSGPARRRPGGTSTWCRSDCAPVDGGHASRTSARSRRPPRLVSVSVDVAGSVSRTDAGTSPPDRDLPGRRGERRRRRRTRPRRAASTAARCRRRARRAPPAEPSAASTTARQVATRHVSGGRGRTRARCRGRSRC